ISCLLLRSDDDHSLNSTLLQTLFKILPGGRHLMLIENLEDAFGVRVLITAIEQPIKLIKLLWVIDPVENILALEIFREEFNSGVQLFGGLLTGDDQSDGIGRDRPQLSAQLAREITRICLVDNHSIAH